MNRKQRRIYPSFAVLALGESGCAARDASPPHASADAGYADFQTVSAGDLTRYRSEESATYQRSAVVSRSAPCQTKEHVW